MRARGCGLGWSFGLLRSLARTTEMVRRGCYSGVENPLQKCLGQGRGVPGPRPGRGPDRRPGAVARRPEATWAARAAAARGERGRFPRSLDRRVVERVGADERAALTRQLHLEAAVAVRRGPDRTSPARLSAAGRAGRARPRPVRGPAHAGTRGREPARRRPRTPGRGARALARTRARRLAGGVAPGRGGGTARGAASTRARGADQRRARARRRAGAVE